jgi:succinoglycan biosynthesis protein ExoM
MVEVTIAVPSFRRPRGLERLLIAVENLNTTASVSVLVADNDAEKREAFTLCVAMRAGGYRWPLECIIAEERGIAQARNALANHIVSQGSADFVAMLDDDEWPDENWLEEFLAVQRTTNADALHGAVVRAFECAPGSWAKNCHGIAPMRGRTGVIPVIDSTSNVLLRRSCFEHLAKPCFDPNFALSGGEDRDFFERLRRNGKRFAWADEAIAHAWVPASRASFCWALQRAYRTGNSDMRVFLKHWDRRAEFLREILKIAGAALFYPLLLLVSLPLLGRRANALCKLFRAAGKTAALFGHRYDEYATIHGV